MSNTLSVRRTQFQEIDEQGNPVGPPSFGILASDAYEQGFTDVYSSREELETAIVEAGGILNVVGGFDDVTAPIGVLNYRGPSYADPEDNA
jgi:hypothetical protein